MYIYKNFEVPRLTKENRDIVEKIKKIKLKYALLILLLFAFDAFIYYFYFIKGGKEYSFGSHFFFWIIFFVVPFCWARLDRIFTEKSYAAKIDKIRHREVYWYDRFDLNKRFTRRVVDYTVLSENNKKTTYRAFEREQQHLVLDQTEHLVKFAGFKYAVAVNDKIPKYFICAKCGYLNGVSAKNCERCSYSIIKIFTRDSYFDALEKIDSN